MKYYIISGEASGDLHASNLVKAMKRLDAHAQFRAWGGDLLEAEGAYLVKHYRDLAFMGFAEVILNLPTILQNFKICKQDLLEYKPDVLILVDYPGFNLRMAEFAKKHGIRVFYYISPQIWAWKKGRIHKIKRVVDQMFTILPFEKDFYAKYNCDVHYLGHPLLDAICQTHRHEEKKNFIGEERKTVALLPGSRKQEISRMLPLMLDLEKDFADVRFIIAGAPGMDKDYYQPFLSGYNATVVFGETYDVLQKSDAALVTSGTATLEAALIGVPQVLCYKANPVSMFIAKRLVDLKYIGLPNLIMDKEIVPELIQEDCNYNQLKKYLSYLLFDPSFKEKQFSDYHQLREKLGGQGASMRIAAKMMEFLQSPEL